MDTTYSWNERSGSWQRFDGKRPRKAILSANLPALRTSQPLDSYPDASLEIREKALNQAVEEAIFAGGTVMQKGELTAIIGQKKPINHGLHIFLSIITVGMWLTPYLIIVIARGDIRYRLEVDRWGHVWPSVA